MERIEILYAVILLANFGLVAYAIIRLIRKSFQNPRAFNTGWIWVVVLLQGIGALIYLAANKK
ncbi:hypothetical protein C900_05185 [Fulvivirga imtechensis AK7]|uniref:Cardiolipin synthase N-terminal domain-containing protein n=1 Tax=Fulvivirga imtechensis AK7 TaxID=1237149 RepID=L8JK82_9BACT|nr:PLDc N-terminal domain-containing protein [Fulvivirga imtechensis]ELR69301.1 hypothetical protein C900_05185 [Fulvivirga imtechensis AK7]